MARSDPTIIKKYANRRLYHTGTSTYVTLDDLARMVKEGEDFLVHDAKSGEDITRVVLGQIIFDQENKGQHMLPIAFLRQLIRFYGDSMQNLVPSYLETSFAAFTRDKDKIRDQMAKAMQGNGAFDIMEDTARRNMEMFQEAMRMWMPFQTGSEGESEEAESGDSSAGKPGAQKSGVPKSGAQKDSELDAMRRQLRDMQNTIDEIAKKD
jgi:polyhydroxyalkanoate synthesis repressor PhaR